MEVEPVAPVVPVTPVSPVTPVVPVLPVAPVEPVAPVLPVEPAPPNNLYLIKLPSRTNIESEVDTIIENIVNESVLAWLILNIG